ncbi:DUF2946 family protein [Aquincola sp. MAHUQ-54]|uniref:DUF2946 family protein n=1 Tax=Aquincola agrisoli TaxID=3119538 RepID=A0AAW9PXS8_9BURK
MQPLRSATRLYRLVVAWFMLSLGVAVASPIVHPQSMELVCSAAGSVKLIVQNGDGTATELGSVGMDCPLCLPVGAPPPSLAATLVLPALPLAYALQSVPSARIAAATAAPLPARGPPALR